MQGREINIQECSIFRKDSTSKKDGVVSLVKEINSKE